MSKASGPKPMIDLLEGALGRKEILRMARAHRALRQWPEVVGEAMASRSMPDRYERGTVWVAVQGSAWAQELRMMKDRILAKLSDLANDRTLFTDIRFGVRPFSPADPPSEATIPTVDPRPREELSGLSIREIADRRMEEWRRETGD